MLFHETPLPGAWLIEPRFHADDRGYFTCTYSRRAMADHGCNPDVHECNSSFNLKAGTLRGMHFQIAPFQQPKLVRCVRGAIWDCIIDLRPGSPAFRQWFGIELTTDNRKQLYIPEGFAHGFITLADDTEVFYQMGNVYHPDSARGVRWNDPAFDIRWPRPVSVIIERDATYPDFHGEVR